MVKITERSYETTGRPAFICDFSPPRSPNPAQLPQPPLGADILLVAYNPGRAVRVNSAMLAAHIRQSTGMETAFTLVTRDMNRLALQSHLLGAELLGLQNMVVARGDSSPGSGSQRLREVNDYRPTEFIASIAAMNRGMDFRDAKLLSPTNFCIGTTADLGRGIQCEARLAYRKITAGAHFLVTQPIFDPTAVTRFYEAYAEVTGEKLTAPVFFGLQILVPDGVTFGAVPETIRGELAAGRSGVEIALELCSGFRDAGLHNFYLIPPIRRGGGRDYAAAQELLAIAKSW